MRRDICASYANVYYNDTLYECHYAAERITNIYAVTGRLPMLLVNAKAGPSRIHGMGLIAQEFIPQGTEIWHFMPGFDVIIPEKFLEHLSLVARKQVFYWAYFNVATRTFVLSSDDDRFTNHSDEPNTRHVGDSVVAQCDIHSGVEITSDYTQLVMINFPKLSDHGVSLGDS